MNRGGLFLGNPWDEGDKQKRFCLLWGEVTRDAQEKCFRKAVVEFGVKYKRKVFVNCSCWSDNRFYPVARMLRRGDIVLLCGIYSEIEYETKKDTQWNKAGEKKLKRDLEVHFVIPDSSISNALLGYIPERADDDRPDPFMSEINMTEGVFNGSADDYEDYTNF